MADADVVSCCLHALVLYVSQIQLWGMVELEFITNSEKLNSNHCR